MVESANFFLKLSHANGFAKKIPLKQFEDDSVEGAPIRFVFENDLLLPTELLSDLKIEIEFSRSIHQISTEFKEIEPTENLMLKTNINMVNQKIFQLVQDLQGKGVDNQAVYNEI